MNQPLPASAAPYDGAPDPPRRAFRSLDDALIGGVASGLARHLGVPVLWMRAAFLIATAIGGFGIVTYAALWLLLPAERHFDDSAPGLSAATRQGKRQGRRAMALADAGPLVALGRDRDRGDRPRRGAHRRRRVPVAAAARRGRHRGALAAGRRGAARALARHDRPDRPDPGGDRARRLGVVRADRGGCRVPGRGDRAVRGARRQHRRGPRRGDRGAARGARGGPDDRALAVPALVGPDRGAGRADPLAGARRRGRAPARLGAADPGADPEDGRRPGRGGPARAGPGARPAAVALHLRRAPTAPRSRRRCAQAAAEVEDQFGVPVEVVCVGDRDLPESVRPLVLAAREAMVNAAKHCRRRQIDVYAEVDRTRHRGVRARPRRRVRGRRRSPTTGTACATASSAGWSGTAATATVRSTAGEGTEVRLHLPERRQEMSR